MLNLQSSLKAAACMAAVALAAISCSQDELTDQSVLKGNTTIVASFEGANTRTSVNEDNQVVWNKDDAFGLFYTSDTQTAPKAEKFTCPNADGTSTTATFGGTLEGEVTTSYAVYPYQEGMSLSTATVTTTLPASFNYKAASNGPMYAKASDISKSIQFKHLTGLLKLTISKGITNKAKKFVITADKAIAGTATADLSTDNPVLAVADQNNSKTITVNLNVSATEDQVTTFYIPIPVGVYTTLSAKLLGDGDSELFVTKEWTNVNVARAGMLTTSFGFVTVDASTSTTNDAIKDAINDAIPANPTTETTTEIQITGAIDASTGISEIAVPVTANSNVSLSLAAVPTTTDDNPLALADATNTGVSTPAETSTNTVTIAIPKVEEANNAPVINITMPSSTVVLDATGTEGTTYKTITAKTANNTLVIKKNVTVSKLIVAGGNVRVAGTITELSKDENFSDTPYLIKEEGASIPDNITGFTVIDAAVYDMMQVAKKGGTYVLSADVVLSEPLAIESTLTLDLNGHSITPKAGGLNKILNTQDALVLVRRGANLTITDSSDNHSGSIDTKGVTGVYAAVKLTDSNDTGEALAKLIVNNGTIKGENYGIVGNGTRHGTEVTINGGTIEASNSADGTGIYHPQDGTLTVTDGTISGYSAGIEIRSGKLVVTGGTIKNTATDFSEIKDGNGTTIVGAAVAVSQHVTNKDLNATIKGGKLQGGVYALYEKDMQDSNSANISLEATGGNLDGKVFSQNCVSFIKGGTFSDPSILDYAAANAQIGITLNKDVNVTNYYYLNAEGANVNIDLNNYDIINSTEIVNDEARTQIFIVNKGTLNIKGNGNVKCDASNTTTEDGFRLAVQAQGDGIVNIYGGSYYNTQKKNTQIDLIYAIERGKINIYGGTFESAKYGTPDNENGRYWVLNIQNASKETADIKVYGGTFINFNPTKPNVDDKEPYTADGYEVTRDGVVYTEAHKVSDGRKEYIVRKKEAE